jgi:hypothetical protein
MKDRFLQTFIASTHQPTLMVEFYHRTQKEGETLSVYALALDTLYSKANPYGSGATRELALLAAFIKGMKDQVLAIQLHQHHFVTLASALRFAKVTENLPAPMVQLPVTRKPDIQLAYIGDGTAQAASSTGRSSRSTSPRRPPYQGCYQCGSKDHWIANCPKSQPSLSPITCTNCNDDSHATEHCLKKPGKRSSSRSPSATRDSKSPKKDKSQQTCHNCGRKGHYAYECPTRTGRSPSPSAAPNSKGPPKD